MSAAPKRSLIVRLEGAAQACHAAQILSCEATCREAAAALQTLLELVQLKALKKRIELRVASVTERRYYRENKERVWAEAEAVFDQEQRL